MYQQILLYMKLSYLQRPQVNFQKISLMGNKEIFFTKKSKFTQFTKTIITEKIIKVTN